MARRRSSGAFGSNMMLGMVAMALSVGIDHSRYSPEDYEDPDREYEPPKKDYSHVPLPLSDEANKENKRLALEKEAKKEAEDAILRMLKEENPGLSGKALRKKLKEIRRNK